MAPRKSAAEKKEVEVKEVKVEVETEVLQKKYRYDFKTWKEYWAYKGPKG